ncbi:MAG: hypothetical protein FWE84_06190, partial [Firmicutes bacterium]|nr:hypothetical protein [Bacillota bacterium]
MSEKPKKKFRDRVNSEPLVFATVFFLIAAAGIVFPLKWLGTELWLGGKPQLWVAAAIRIVLGGAGFVLLV